MKAAKKVNGKWVTEHPENLSAWLWQHDGLEAVVIDGTTFYCSTPELVEQFRVAWSKEGKKNDKRTVAMFGDLDRALFQREVK